MVLVRVSHGRTNSVYIDHKQGTILKRYAPRKLPLWRSSQREGAALKIAAGTGLVPALIEGSETTLESSAEPGLPYPEALHAGSLDVEELASRAGQMLRRIHECSPTHEWANEWTHLMLPGSEAGESWVQGIRNLMELLCKELCRQLPWLRQIVALLLDAFYVSTGKIDEPLIGLVHGDYCGANLLADPECVVDWEWAFVGDVTYDLARLRWLDEIGRKHHVYSSANSEVAFYRAYGIDNSAHDLHPQYQAYGTLMAISHCLQARVSGKSLDPYLLWIRRSISGSNA